MSLSAIVGPRISRGSASLSLKRIQYWGCFFFFISGLTALIYEILWLRVLGLIYGNTSYALATVLAATMTGLGLGSYGFGRLSARIKNPLRVYGLLELGIGGFAALTFPLAKWIETGYLSVASHTSPDHLLVTLFRFVFSFVILLIPTFAMGATFPVLVAFFVRQKEAIGSKTALLYGINTAGAVVGTLLAGFVLLPLVGMRKTLLDAVLLNLVVGAAAFLFSHQSTLGSKGAPPPVIPKERVSLSAHQKFLLGGIFISGFLAMVYEVAWTRIFGAILGSSTYAFTLMLATFLTGISIGSFVFKRLLRDRAARWSEWAGLHFLIAGSVILTLPLFEHVGLWNVRLYALSIGNFALYDLLRFGTCIFFMGLPTLGFGALFPVTVSLYTSDADRIGAHVGVLYLVNTLGNLSGSLAAGFLLIPLAGIHATFQLAVAIGAALALLFAVYFARTQVRVRTGAMLLSGLIVMGLFWTRGGWNPALISQSFHIRPIGIIHLDAQQIRSAMLEHQILYYREGLNSIVDVSQIHSYRTLRVNGKPDASTSRSDMSTQVMMAHLPLLLHPNPKEGLVIGFGSGVTAASALKHPLQHLDVVEIESAVLEAAPFFSDVNENVVQNPRAKIILNDGRNHLLMTDKRYDIIISEPSNPWMAGISNLFTIEFYELAKKHLAKDGLFCQWLQTYNIAPNDFQMVLASVAKAFPHVTLWRASMGDMLILAGENRLEVDVDRLTERFKGLDAVAEDLERYQIFGAGGLLGNFVFGEEDLARFVEGAELNTDDHLKLEYRAPLSLFQETTPLIEVLLARYQTQDLPPIKGAGERPSENSDFLAQQGYVYFNLGDRARAKSYFDRALERQVMHAGATAGLAAIYLKDQKPEMALEVAQNLLIEKTGTAQIYAALGAAHLALKQMEEAERAYAKAAALDPSEGFYAAQYAHTLEANQKNEAAAALFLKASHLSPDRLEGREGYARNKRLAGQPQKASIYLEAMRRDFPLYYPFYKELAAAYRETGDFDLALHAYESLLRRNPYKVQYWQDYVDLCIFAQEEKKYAWAIRQLTRLDPMSIQVWRLKPSSELSP